MSGFDARPAGIYLPPAALVDEAPALPLVIMMMGYPGNPDPSFIAATLDGLAAQNKGLAPIVIVADQIGNGGDPACADSAAFGNAETYIKTDVVNWAKQNLHIIDDPASWVIAGYSNGGGCAIKYGAEEPDVFKNILDISGEPFPGSEDPARCHRADLRRRRCRVRGGQAGQHPRSQRRSVRGSHRGLHRRGRRSRRTSPPRATVSDAAITAGMTVTLYTVPGAGHVGEALTGGLQEGFTVLYPVLGLSPP